MTGCDGKDYPECKYKKQLANYLAKQEKQKQEANNVKK
jgi:hypothetical protein